MAATYDNRIIQLGRAALAFAATLMRKEAGAQMHVVGLDSGFTGHRRVPQGGDMCKSLISWTAPLSYCLIALRMASRFFIKHGNTSRRNRVSEVIA